MDSITRPNIIVLMGDEHTFAHTGCYGSEIVKTPTIDALAARDGLVVEGVMGLFDASAAGWGSSADVARRLSLPVLLVVSAERMSHSVAALVHGFATFEPTINVAGVVLTRVASARHEAMLRAALASSGARVLGALARSETLALPSRHLGLVQAGEHGDLAARIEDMADAAEDALDVDALARIGEGTAPPIGARPAAPLPPLGQRIAVARDPAFAFVYEHILDGWQAAGASVHPFSPLADEAPDAEADAIYLPGGYPELHAATIARNRRFILGLQAAAWRGCAILGECGGYMVLGQELVDRQGTSHPMAELLPLTTSFAAPRLHLGYRELRLAEAGPLGARHLRWRGHEFHYASETAREGPPLFLARDAEGTDLGPVGCRQGNVMGAFVHLVDRLPHLAVVR